MTELPERIGVAGAGTMGAGIAQVSAMAGFEVRLLDPDEAVRTAARDRIGAALERGIERGRWSAEDAAAALGRLETVAGTSSLAGCGLVIEAVPESLDLKRKVLGEIAEACGAGTVLASNTSSISIGAIAAPVPEPGRVIGMHFFNPVPAMRLVEVISGEATGEEALATGTEFARSLGKTPIRAKDAIGFVANRCARPFTLEGLRVASELGLEPAEIDRICRIGGGFRMGPFELIDLVGVDINLDVARSFFEQSFGEPRWRPHPTQVHMAGVGRLGRKSGRGFYEYGEAGAPHRASEPELEDNRPILDPSRLAEVAGERAPKVLSWISAQIVNEAVFTLAAGIASEEDIDTAMRLGFNWPVGPLEWGRRIGHATVLARLEELRRVYGEAYRPAPLLRQLAG